MSSSSSRRLEVGKCANLSDTRFVLFFPFSGGLCSTPFKVYTQTWPCTVDLLMKVGMNWGLAAV